MFYLYALSNKSKEYDEQIYSFMPMLTKERIARVKKYSKKESKTMYFE